MPIRPATPADADAITAIYNDAIANTTAILWHEPKPVSLWRDRLTDRPSHFPVLVATDDSGAVVGFALLGPYDDKCGYDGVAEWSVYLAEGSRGQGIGLALSGAVIQAGRAAGLHSVLSRVTEGNTVSEKLHERLGFTKVGTFKQLGQKFGRRHDVIAYQLVL
ncbi:MAG: GNAT family N-acetyltransferase [Phycisphaeraceae bacterium]|nr:GNAT family N-acetyltransferase [Phycisphaeraceae bacterium]